MSVERGAWSMERGACQSGNRRPETGEKGAAGFSLVEVTVAIGIFAFVVVGILGLLPAGMKLRAESAQETRAVLIAQELFSAVRTANTLSNVIVRDGPALSARNNEPEDLFRGPVVFGYPSQTTVPFGLFSVRRGGNPDEIWRTGQLPEWAVDNDIATLARLTTTNVPGYANLFQVTVEVRSPASLNLTNSKPSVFTTYVSSPPPTP
jgi:type II secretory pathway pseudopilin PulG